MNVPTILLVLFSFGGTLALAVTIAHTGRWRGFPLIFFAAVIMLDAVTLVHLTLSVVHVPSPLEPTVTYDGPSYRSPQEKPLQPAPPGANPDAAEQAMHERLDKLKR